MIPRSSGDLGFPPVAGHVVPPAGVLAPGVRGVLGVQLLRGPRQAHGELCNWGDRASLTIGTERCPFEGEAEILLTGRKDSYQLDGDYRQNGEKFLAVMAGGSLEIHGRNKLSWTKLSKTVHPPVTHHHSVEPSGVSRLVKGE